MQELSPHSYGYIIPRNQSNCKMYALILFNLMNRPGAEGEAGNLEDSLKIAGFEEPLMFQWTNPNELHNMIGVGVDGVRRENCSLFMVCLMSHGSMGSLEAGGGNKTQINSILHQLKGELPPDIPLVRPLSPTL